MRTRTRNPFTTVKTAGLLLPIDLLARIADGDPNLPGLTPESYHLDAGDRLNEAAARAWNECSAAWKRFRQELETLPASDAGTTLTRERWLLWLFKELGYGRLQPQKAIPIDDKSYPISHGWAGHIPIHLVSCKLALDRRTPGAAGAASRSPYSLVQELLNRSAQHRWGFLSNGRTLYVLRDNLSLTRAANVEFDLETMFDGDVFADFKLLFLLCHQSRVEIPSDGKPEECWLEKWSKLADDQGTRAREKLRIGVQSAIEALGAGFLTTRGNTNLRDRLRSGELATQDYYRQLLRMVYRLLLLFVAEEKKDENSQNLFHPPGTPDQARHRYAQYYSVGRLRTLAGKRRGTTHNDLYVSLNLLFLNLRSGYEPLGIPGFGSFLFSPTATPDLDSALLSNESLLEAIRALCITEDTSGRGAAVRRPVDFANLGSDELGSVYESLLELHPKIDTDEGPFTLGTAAGHERKTTGSYYTPTSLINCLLDSALDPVAKQALSKPTPVEAEKALLNLKVCDPACGSGHFLIAAAERLAKYLASLRTGDDEPSTLAIQHARRDIIGRCIFGVDINPMSVELCQVALWMEALEPGKPFSFLEHHIQCGNSLIGTTPALLAKGIPDEAFTPIEGDDKKLCTAFKKRNKEEHRGQSDMFEERYPWERMGNLAAAIADLDTLPDDTADHVRTKAERYRKLVEEGTYRTSGKFLADLWCAAFVWRKDKTFDYPITERIFRRVEANPHDLAPWMYDEIRRLAGQYQFFHWHLAFPGIFRPPSKDEAAENEGTAWNGGFDVVLGNPPWEKMQFEERQFIESRGVSLVTTSAAERKRFLVKEQTAGSTLANEIRAAKELMARESSVITESGLFPLCGKGKFNKYAIFFELALQLIARGGRSGQIVKSGLATDFETKEVFFHLIEHQRLVSLIDFENRESLFPGVAPPERFCLITAAGHQTTTTPRFVFNLTNVAQLAETDRQYILSRNQIERMNPNTRNCPVFRSSHDAVLTAHIYLWYPVIDDESHDKNPYQTRFDQQFNVTDDAHLFRNETELLQLPDVKRQGQLFVVGATEYLPLTEPKFFQLYDHRFGTFNGVSDADKLGRKASTRRPSLDEKQSPDFVAEARYWVPRVEFDARRSTDWNRNYYFVFRGITNISTNARTAIGGVIPAWPLSKASPALLFDGKSVGHSMCLFTASFSSFAFDYVCRQKIGGPNLNIFIVKQLPIVPRESIVESKTLSEREIISRVLELTYTAWDLEPFARDCEFDGPPFRWDEERRFLLRCELDAAFFHLYLPADEGGQWRSAPNEKPEELACLKASFPTPRDAVSYIMDTFPIVRRKDEDKYDGEYRTKRVILEIYDAMQEAIRTDQPYQTRLDPPPGPPNEPLPEWKPGQPKPANWPSHIHPPRGCRATLTDDWRLNDVAAGAVLPPSFKLILDDHEISNGVERRWKCKTIAAADALPESDMWVLLRHPDLMRANKSIPVALGKLTYQELTDANTKQKVMVVTLRGPVPPAQVRIPFEEWPSFRPLAVLEPLDS